MDVQPWPDLCTVTECHLAEKELDEFSSDAEDRLSVVVLYDRPFDSVALDEALFSLAIQDYQILEVILVLPDCGQDFHSQAELAIHAHSWPSSTTARVVSARVRTSEMISAWLLNAGARHATGRYIAFLHHQDLVYQHAYKALVERLRATDSAVAFGGVRVAAHLCAYRHWMVSTKHNPQKNVSRLSVVLDERSALHSFVIDCGRLERDYLFAHNPNSRLAVTMFLSRLALHDKADFELAGKKMVESRRAPHSSVPRESGPGRLLLADTLPALLAGEGFSLHGDALCVRRLFSDALSVLRTQARVPVS